MAVDETGQDEPSQQDARLTSLDQRLDRAKREEALRTGNKPSEESQRLIRSVGSRILSDLVGLPFGGGLIGWLIDQWAGTKPWFMLALLFLGFGLAVRNVMRIANQGPKRPEGS
ncbi:MAG: AtpZ/AtpI family protein [Sphingomicrobium sp.]